MNKTKKKYLNNCKKVFPFFPNKERIFYNRLKEAVLNYENDNPSYTELVEIFGSPKDILDSYMESCDNDYLMKKANAKHLIKGSIIILIIGLSIISILELYTIINLSNQDIIAEETLIEYN